MRVISFLIILLTPIIFSCTKKTPIQYVSLSHKQTICADLWLTGSSDSLTLVNVAHYLDSLGLYIASLLIKLDNSPESCTACTCKTGKTIYVSTFENLKDSYLTAGFQ